MRHTIKAFIHKGKTYPIAECLELAVVTQRKTLDQTVANLNEAAVLHLEAEDSAHFDPQPSPSLLVTLELEPAGAS